MKLIPMTDYVLSTLDESAPNKFIEAIASIRKYAEFLKRPLSLGMFVPVDDEGNVLQEPKNWGDYVSHPEAFDGNKEWFELYNYEQAKEKVLFEGFENKDTRSERRQFEFIIPCHKYINNDIIETDQYGLFFYGSYNEVTRLNIVEDLLKFEELPLTESAIKQFT